MHPVQMDSAGAVQQLSRLSVTSKAVLHHGAAQQSLLAHRLWASLHLLRRCRHLLHGPETDDEDEVLGVGLTDVETALTKNAIEHSKDMVSSVFSTFKEQCKDVTDETSRTALLATCKGLKKFERKGCDNPPCLCDNPKCFKVLKGAVEIAQIVQGELTPLVPPEVQDKIKIGIKILSTRGQPKLVMKEAKQLAKQLLPIALGAVCSASNALLPVIGSKICGVIVGKLTEFALADQEIKTEAKLSKLLEEAERRNVDIVDRALMTQNLRSAVAYGNAIQSQVEDSEEADAMFRESAIDGLANFSSYNRFAVIEHDLVMATALLVPPDQGAASTTSAKGDFAVQSLKHRSQFLQPLESHVELYLLVLARLEDRTSGLKDEEADDELLRKKALRMLRTAVPQLVLFNIQGEFEYQHEEGVDSWEQAFPGSEETRLFQEAWSSSNALSAVRAGMERKLKTHCESKVDALDSAYLADCVWQPVLKASSSHNVDIGVLSPPVIPKMSPDSKGHLELPKSGSWKPQEAPTSGEKQPKNRIVKMQCTRGCTIDLADVYAHYPLTDSRTEGEFSGFRDGYGLKTYLEEFEQSSGGSTWLFPFASESHWSDSLTDRFSGKCPPGSFVSRVAMARAHLKGIRQYSFGPIQCRTLENMVLEPGTLYRLDKLAEESKPGDSCEERPSSDMMSQYQTDVKKRMGQANVGVTRKKGTFSVLVGLDWSIGEHGTELIKHSSTCQLAYLRTEHG